MNGAINDIFCRLVLETNLSEKQDEIIKRVVANKWAEEDDIRWTLKEFRKEHTSIEQEILLTKIEIELIS